MKKPFNKPIEAKGPIRGFSTPKPTGWVPKINRENKKEINAKQQKVIDRVKKLLAIADNENAPMHEKENAMGHAQKLILEHNLSEDFFESKEEIVSEPIYEMDGVSASVWKERIINVICDVNYCYCFFKPGTKEKNAKFVAYGTPNNLEIVRILIDLILNQVYYYAHDYQGAGKSEKNSFKLGMATRISQRLRETHKEVVNHYLQNSNNNAALVKLDSLMLAAKELAVKQNNLVIINRNTNILGDAYKAGMNQGNSVELNFRPALK